MKLVYLANNRLPTEKAHGLQIAKMCEAFADLGIEVELLIPTRKNPHNSANFFKFYNIKKNFTVKRVFTPDFNWQGKLERFSFYAKNICSAIALFLSVLSSKTDVIYSRDESSLYLLSFFKKYICFEAHRFSNRRSLFYRRFKKNNIKIIVISEGLKNDFIKFGFDPKNILIAHDGVDFDQFNITENRDDCRSRLNLPKTKKIIGYVGQLRTMGMGKGIDILIEAYLILKNNFTDLMVVIVGGNHEDLVTYKNIARQKGLSEEEILFVGRKDYREIPYYLKAFNVLVMPFPSTKHYAFYMSPLKLFEYMASKRPIVASDLPSLREVLNENNAVLVKPDDYKAFAEGILKMIEQPQLAGELAENAFEKVRDFTWDKRAQRIIDFFDIECQNITL